jgi:hypothetical protein
MHNYSGDVDVFCGDSGLIRGAENITDIVDHFRLFFDKHCESVIQDTSRYTDQYKITGGNLFFLFCKDVETCHGR